MNEGRESDDGFKEERLSLIETVGYRTSTCGYCGPKGERSQASSSRSFGIWAHHLSPYAYEQLIERGWRRSGRFVYRPDCSLRGTCCAQLAIRLRAEQFRPKKEHKHALACLQRALCSDAPLNVPSFPSQQPSPSHAYRPLIGNRAKGKYARVWNAEEEWKKIEGHAQDKDLIAAEQAITIGERQSCLARFHTARSVLALELRKGKAKDKTIGPPFPLLHRRLRTTLSAACSTDEKYTLFRRYQANVHGEKEDVISSKNGFERFLCESPFLGTHPLGRTSPLAKGQEVDVHSDEPIHYGLYHMEWRLNGKLIAVGVLDVLPRYLSSVYLFYDPEFAALELGKVSAIREIVLVEQLRRKRGMKRMEFYTMGLYIHNCAKMRYKAKFGPAELLDPATNQWIRIDKIKQALDLGARHDFLSQTNEDIKAISESDRATMMDVEEEGFLSTPPPPGIQDPLTLSSIDLGHCIAFDGTKAALLTDFLPTMPSEKKRRVLDCVAALDLDRHLYCLVV